MYISRSRNLGGLRIQGTTLRRNNGLLFSNNGSPVDNHANKKKKKITNGLKLYIKISNLIRKY